MSFSELYFDVWSYLVFHPWVGLLVYGVLLFASIYVVLRPKKIVGVMPTAIRKVFWRGASVENPDVGSGWLRRALSQPTEFRPYTLTLQLAAGYGVLLMSGGTIFSGYQIINEQFVEPKLLSVEFVNRTNQTVFVRHERFTCSDGFNSYFNDSINLGDPRLKFHIPSGASDESYATRSNNARSTAACHRIGAVDETGTILLLQSFTNREMTSRDWKIVFKDQ